jgi:hypothetical protein
LYKQELLSYIKEYNLNIDDANELIHDAVLENGIEELLELIADQEYIRKLAIGITHYCFRNGPIESMHAGINPKFASEDIKPEDISQFSEDDMKKLNKYMVDKLGFLIHLLVEGRYFEVALLLDFHLTFGTDWDSPEIEKEEKHLKDLLSIFSR